MHEADSPRTAGCLGGSLGTLRNPPGKFAEVERGQELPHRGQLIEGTKKLKFA